MLQYNFTSLFSQLPPLMSGGWQQTFPWPLPPTTRVRPLALQVLFLSNSLREQKHKTRSLLSPTKEVKTVHLHKKAHRSYSPKPSVWRKEPLWLYFCQECLTVLVKGFIESGALRMEDKSWRIPVVLQIKAGRKIRGKPGDLGFIWRTQHGRFPSYCNPLQFEHPQNTHNSNFTWDFQGPIYEQQSAREYKIPFYDPRKPDKESHSY